MDNHIFFESGRMIIGGREYKLDDIKWNPHPAFKGVSMKHIIKGTDTKGRLSCHLVKIDPNFVIDSHIHEGRMELHEVIGGTGKCIIGEETFDYHDGVVSYIPDDINHMIEAGNHGLFILAKFSPALL